MDVHNKITRSYNMSRIKGEDTGPKVAIVTHSPLTRIELFCSFACNETPNNY